jgi:hypothetical protein
MNRSYEHQFDNMQRMNQKWLDAFSKSWEHQQNEKTWTTYVAKRTSKIW